MKKIITISLLLTLVLAIIAPPAITPKTKTLAASSEQHLQSPSQIIATETDIYVVDTLLSCILKKPKNSTEISASIVLPGIKSLKQKEDSLIALTTDENHPIKLISNDLTQLTNLTLSSPISLSNAIDLSYNNGKILILNSSGEIIPFSISSQTVNLAGGAITPSILGGELQTATYQKIHYNGTDIFVQTTNGIFKINESNLTNVKIINSRAYSDFSANNVYICGLSENSLFLHSLQQNSTEEFEVDFQANLTNIYLAEDNLVYLSSPSTHQVLVYNFETQSLTDLNINSIVSKTLFSAENFKHITLTEPASLYLQPYSLNAKLHLQSGTKLTLIGEAIGFEYYYCMYQDSNKNNYLYLPKTNLSYTTQSNNTTTSLYVAIRKINVYTLPSVKEDNTNKIINTISSQTEVETYPEIISNGKDNFYLIKTADGTKGFALASSLQPLKETVELTLMCNAKTKRETKLMESPTSQEEIITLSKNTRIKLEEELSPNKTHIKVSYQTENGIIYTGYILASDIKTDGLTTLQILGLILVIVNILVLLVIVIIKRKLRRIHRA